MPRWRSKIIPLTAVVLLLFISHRALRAPEWNHDTLKAQLDILDAGKTKEHQPPPPPPPPPPPKPSEEEHAQHVVPDAAKDQQHPPPPKKPDPPAPPAAPTPPKKDPLPGHWAPHPDFYPVPDDQVIPLPTGTPMPIPKIQFDFSAATPESAAAKEKRLMRLKAVKAEIDHAWTGYVDNAWMHDELRPVSKDFRDPFCGWAATLVDSLDTLWIAGLHDQFDKAARAVANIDFTYTPRDRIPVFETTIRYLGGLLAAYDLSGGKQGEYPILLEKAVELANVLMDVFDTPNRMPVLYYSWRPDIARMPKKSYSAVIAEIGSLSMEFTRLAQLTGHNRYYDAVARITDALEELQNAGTSVPGIFPEMLDTTGCNATATEEKIRLHQQAVQARQINTPTPNDNDHYYTHQQVHNKRDRPLQRLETPPGTTNEQDADPRSYKNCIHQGLRPADRGFESYSMGAMQDSTYEYFPKQFLLLGGLVPKYKAMHQKAISAIKSSLLYRPMIPDSDRDLRFSGKLTFLGTSTARLAAAQGQFPPPKMTYEVTHLTCFLGGMFGLGGRITGNDEDVELAKKLADGCVWAYESSPSGLMPESATVAPCNDVAHCPWNQTHWQRLLDPAADWRDDMAAKWDWEHDETKTPASSDQDVLAVPGSGASPTTIDELENHGEHRTGPMDVEHLRPQSDRDLAATKEQLITAPEKRAVIPDPGSAPLMSGGNRMRTAGTLQPVDENARPQTHEEYIATRLEMNRIPKGFVTLDSRMYILRPEAIESVWYMYRLTGDTAWQDKGWRMFEAVLAATRTAAGHSAVEDVTAAPPVAKNEMESFWIAETLKYFYLLFAEPDVVSLDEWVLNTEAHPFKRPTPPPTSR